MKTLRFVVIAIALTAMVLALGAGQALAKGTVNPMAVQLQTEFDPLGPTVHSMELSSGRTANYIDVGDPSWRPVVFIGGAGTAVRVFTLTEFLRSSREALKLRVVSVERNGFGQTLFTPGIGKDEYAQDVLEVVNSLGISSFSIVAISGGGPYAAALAATAPERVVSLHLAVALYEVAEDSPMRDLTDEQLSGILYDYSLNPMYWWWMPPDSPVQQIEGWQDSAYEDGARSFYVRGQLNDPAPLTHEYKIFMEEPTDVSSVTAPAYLYYGEEDTSVPVWQMEAWEAALPNVAKANLYPGEAHAVQYRHWDQILVDLAGLGDYTVLGYKGKTLLVKSDKKADRLLARGATLGVAAWAQ